MGLIFAFRVIQVAVIVCVSVCWLPTCSIVVCVCVRAHVSCCMYYGAVIGCLLVRCSPPKDVAVVLRLAARKPRPASLTAHQPLALVVVVVVVVVVVAAAAAAAVAVVVVVVVVAVDCYCC